MKKEKSEKLLFSKETLKAIRDDNFIYVTRGLAEKLIYSAHFVSVVNYGYVISRKIKIINDKGNVLKRKKTITESTQILNGEIGSIFGKRVILI